MSQNNTWSRSNRYKLNGGRRTADWGAIADRRTRKNIRKLNETNLTIIFNSRADFYVILASAPETDPVTVSIYRKRLPRDWLYALWINSEFFKSFFNLFLLVLISYKLKQFAAFGFLPSILRIKFRVSVVEMASHPFLIALIYGNPCDTGFATMCGTFSSNSVIGLVFELVLSCTRTSTFKFTTL